MVGQRGGTTGSHGDRESARARSNGTGVSCGARPSSTLCAQTLFTPSRRGRRDEKKQEQAAAQRLESSYAIAEDAQKHLLARKAWLTRVSAKAATASGISAVAVRTRLPEVLARSPGNSQRELDSRSAAPDRVPSRSTVGRAVCCQHNTSAPRNVAPTLPAACFQCREGTMAPLEQQWVIVQQKTFTKWSVSRPPLALRPASDAPLPAGLTASSPSAAWSSRTCAPTSPMAPSSSTCSRSSPRNLSGSTPRNPSCASRNLKMSTRRWTLSGVGVFSW